MIQRLYLDDRIRRESEVPNFLMIIRTQNGDDELPLAPPAAILQSNSEESLLLRIFESLCSHSL